ncbi:hypothetical protein V8E53_011872 [Lactarius tabidus]
MFPTVLHPCMALAKRTRRIPNPSGRSCKVLYSAEACTDPSVPASLELRVAHPSHYQQCHTSCVVTLVMLQHNLVARKYKMKWHNGDFKRPAAAEHNEHETDLDFDSNVLETQLGGVSNSLQHEKVINTPEFPVVVQTLSPHNPTQLAKVEQSFEKASRSGNVFEAVAMMKKLSCCKCVFNVCDALHSEDLDCSCPSNFTGRNPQCTSPYNMTTKNQQS